MTNYVQHMSGGLYYWMLSPVFESRPTRIPSLFADLSE